MYLQNKALAFESNGADDESVLQLDSAGSLYGLFGDTSASWQTLNTHLSPASLQQSPPCGSSNINDKPAYTITSPAKQVKWVSQPVMLSDLADYSPHEYLVNGKTLCGHVSYDNRRCTNIVSTVNRFCAIHKTAASSLIFNAQKSNSQIWNNDKLPNGTFDCLKNIECVSPSSLFSRETAPIPPQQISHVTNGVDIPDAKTTVSVGNHIPTRSLNETNALINRSSAVQVINHDKYFTNLQSTKMNISNVNHGKKFQSTASTPQAKTIVLDESSLKMLMEIMSSKQKSLTPEQVSFLLSLDITVNQTSDKVKMISQSKPVQIESRKFPVLHPTNHKEFSANVKMSNTSQPTILSTQIQPTLASKIKVNSNNKKNKSKVPIKRKMVSENKKCEKKPRLISSLKQFNQNCANINLATTVTKPFELKQNKFVKLFPIHEHYSNDVNTYLKLHNNSLLQHHHFFPDCPRIKNQKDHLKIPAKTTNFMFCSNRTEFFNCDPVIEAQLSNELYLNEKSLKDQNHAISNIGPTIDELTLNASAMCKTYHNIASNYINELKNKRKVTKALLNLYKSSQMSAKKVLEATETTEKRSRKSCTDNVCQLKDADGKTTCSSKALPFALYCKNHIWHCIDQQLYVVNSKMKTTTDIVNESLKKNSKKTRKRTKLLPLIKRYKKKKKKSKNMQIKSEGVLDDDIKEEVPVTDMQESTSVYNTLEDHEAILQHDLDKFTDEFGLFEGRSDMGLLPTKEETEELERTLLMEMSAESLDKVGSWLEDFALDDLGNKGEDCGNVSLGTFAPSQGTGMSAGGCDILSEDSGIQQDMTYPKHGGSTNIDPFTDVIDTTETTALLPPPVTSTQHYTFGSCHCGLSDLSDNLSGFKTEPVICDTTKKESDESNHVELDNDADIKPPDDVIGKQSLFSHELQEIECVLESLHSESPSGSLLLPDSSVNEKQYTIMLAQQLSQEAETQNFKKSITPPVLPKYSSSDNLVDYDQVFPVPAITDQEQTTHYMNGYHNPQLNERNNGNTSKNLIKTETTVPNQIATVNSSTTAQQANSEFVTKLSVAQQAVCSTSGIGINASTYSAPKLQFINTPNVSVQHTTTTITTVNRNTHLPILPSSSAEDSNAALSTTSSTPVRNVQPQQTAMLQMMGSNNVIPVVIGTGTQQNGNVVKVLIPQSALINNGSGCPQQSMIIIPVNTMVENESGGARQLSAETTGKPLNIAPMNAVKVQMSNLQTGQQFLIVNGNQHSYNFKKTNPLLAQKYVPPALILNPVSNRTSNVHLNMTRNFNGFNSLKAHNRVKPHKISKKTNSSKNASTSVKQKLQKSIMKNGRQNSLNKSIENLNAELKLKNQTKSLKQSNSVPCTSYSSKMASNSCTSCKDSTQNTFQTSVTSNGFLPTTVTTVTTVTSDKSEPVCRTMDRRSKSGPSLSDDEIICEEQGGVDIGDGQNASCGVVHWNQTTAVGPEVLTTSPSTVYVSNRGSWKHQQAKTTFPNLGRSNSNAHVTQQMILGNMGSLASHKSKTNSKTITLPTLPTENIQRKSLNCNEKIQMNGTSVALKITNPTSVPTQTKNLPSLGFVKIGVDSFCSSPINVKLSTVKLNSDNIINNKPDST